MDVRETSVEETEAARFELFDATAHALRELLQGRPLLVVLDDLHAADEPSLLLLRFVCGELTDAPILLLATYREGTLADDDPRLLRLAEIGRQPGAMHVSPLPLDAASVRRYMELTVPVPLPPGIADTVHRQTEGNPLFVTEVVRLLVDERRMERASASGTQRLEIPEGIRALMRRRLGQLSDGARAMLERAAVIGVDVPLEQLTGGWSAPEPLLIDLLDEAARSDVLIPPVSAGGPWRFSHTLVRELIYTSIPAGERMRLHLETGQALETLHRADTEPLLAVLAHHFVEAVPFGDEDKAIAYASRAARRATEMAAHEEAVRHYRKALGIARQQDQGRVGLLIGLGEAATRAGDQATAREAFLEAADIAARLGLVEALARAAISYGGQFVWVRAGTDHALVPLLRRALGALGDHDGPLRVRLLARLAGALRSEADMAPRLHLSEQAVDLARRLDDPSALVFALTSRYWATAGPDSPEGPGLVKEVTDLTGSLGDRERLSDGHVMRFDLLSTTAGDGAAIRAEVEGYGRLAVELRHVSLRWYHQVLSTVMAINDGRLDEAEVLSEQAYRLGERALSRDALMSRHLSLFALRREQGRLADVAASLREAVDAFPDYRYLVCLMAFVDAATGRGDAARQALERLADDAYGFLPRDMSWLFGITCSAEAAVLVGDLPRARELAGLLNPYAMLVGQATSEISGGPVARILGLVAAIEGRPEDALRHVDTAERLSARAGLTTFHARTLVEAARVRVDRNGPGDPAAAREGLARALREARSVGLSATEEAAREVLARLDESPTGSFENVSHGVSDGHATPFRPEGDAWQVGAVRLRRAKGFTYLATLLRHPGREYHVLDLVPLGAHALAPGRGVDPVTSSASHGALARAIPSGGLDAQARRAYRARLAELQEQVAVADASTDPRHADGARWEIEALTRELAAAYGLGGRERPGHSAAERARQSVTKAIRASIAQIATHDPDLGVHLGRAVRTGTYCSYDPEPATRRTFRLT